MLLFLFASITKHSFSQWQYSDLKKSSTENAGLLSSHNRSEFKQYFPPGQYQTLYSIHDSAYYWNWDTLSGTWSSNPYARDIDITYNANYKNTGFIQQAYDGNNWTNDLKTISTYDPDGNLINHTHFSWDGNAWENDVQYIYTYDQNNNQLTYLIQGWNGSWMNEHQEIYTYDQSDNMITVRNYYWADSVWVISSFDSSTYDANGNKLSELLQSGVGGQLDNYYLYTYYYDINNKCISKLRQDWDQNGWVDSRKSTYTYDANQDLTYQLDEYWNFTIWENLGQTFFTYSPVHFKINSLYQSWNGNTWQNSTRLGQNRGPDLFTQSYVFQDWDEAGASVNWGDSIFIFYHTVIGIDELQDEKNLLSVYPNPASSEFTIQSGTLQPAQIQIVNLQGQEMIPATISRDPFTVNSESFPAGIYFVKMISSKETSVRKIIVE